MNRLSKEQKLTGIFLPLLWAISVLIQSHSRLSEYKIQISVWNILPIVIPMLVYANNLRKDNVESIKQDQKNSFKILMHKYMYIVFINFVLLIVLELAYEIYHIGIVSASPFLVSWFTLNQLPWVLGVGGVMIFSWVISKTIDHKFRKGLIIFVVCIINTSALYIIGMYQNGTIYKLGLRIPGSPPHGDMGAWNSLSTLFLNLLIPLVVTLLMSFLFIKISSWIIDKKTIKA